MKITHLLGLILGHLTLINIGHSTEFSNFSLGPLLKERANLLKTGNSSEIQNIGPNGQIRLRSNAENPNALAINSQKLEERIFPRKQNNFVSAALSTETLSSSILYNKILETIKDIYQKEGSTQTNSILQYNNHFNLGSQNFSGVSWQRPMGSFSISVNRQIVPNLFDKNWIVQDTFIININASTFLNALKDNDLINITENQLRAFAGVTFKRSYEYFHYAPSFEEGLVSDFSKLFLTFTKFNSTEVLSLPPSNILKRKDEMSFNAGGYLNSPAWYGISATAGALVQFNTLGELIIQSTGPRDNLRKEDEFLRLSSKKEESKTVGAAASVQLDFFNLIKLTLLSFDLQYEYTSSYEHHFSFFKNEINALSSNNQFQSILNLAPYDLDSFSSNIVQVEERKLENLQSEVAVLLFGQIRSQSLEQTRVITNNQIKTFFKDNKNTLRYVQSPLSRLFGTILQAIFKLNSLVENVVEYIDHTAIEYEAEGEIHNFQVKDEDKFSLEFNHQLKLTETKGQLNQFYRNEALSFMIMKTELPTTLIAKVKNEEIIGPLSIKTGLRILRPGLATFHQQSENLVYYLASNICQAPNAVDWASATKRSELMKGQRKVLRKFLWWTWEAMESLPKLRGHDCTIELGNHYQDYITPIHHSGIIDLAKLRVFIDKFYAKANSYEYLRSLFGRDNVFIFGSFEAKTKEGLPYVTYFKEGEFMGLGVVDNFQRQSEIGRIPASITTE